MYVGIDIAHSTFTFCELTLAMSIGSVTKILTPVTLPNDSITRDTTRQRIIKNEGRFVAVIFDLALIFSDGAKTIPRITPLVAMLISIIVLIGGATCPDSSIIFEWILFALSVLSFS